MSRGKAVWVEVLGTDLMTGEFVRFEKHDKTKSHLGQAVDIKHFSELPQAEQRYWASADTRCRTANFIKVRWAAKVGDTGLSELPSGAMLKRLN